jgi:hypothetical protein
MRPLSTTGFILLAIIAVALIANLPELQRYLRMRNM